MIESLSPGQPTERSALQLRGLQLSPLFRTVALRFSGIAAVLLLFEFVARSGLVQAGYLPPVSEIYLDLWLRLWTTSLWVAVFSTLQGWFIGIAIAALLAVPMGIVIGSFEVLHRLTRGVIDFLRPIPSVAIIPAAVLILGTNQEIKIFLIAFATFWPILTQTIYGVHDADPTALDTARSYGLGHFARFQRVTVPSAAPFIITGIRIASAIGLVLAVTTELVVGVPGLGSAIAQTQSAGAITGTYALILVAGLLGWSLNGMVRVVEARALHWHESFREKP
jgi:ABC-type nitrate/sulfonate/bicarbonate transport system permease component